jgi:glutathione S-transferase
MWESNAILRYLCDAHAPDTPFWPKAPTGRARIDQWMDYQQATLNTPQTIVFQGLIRTPPEKRDMAAIDRAVEVLTQHWALIDKALAGRAWLAAGHLTFAEMVFGPNLHRWFNFPIERPDMPNLRGWYERMLEREAFVKHCGGPVV